MLFCKIKSGTIMLKKKLRSISFLLVLLMISCAKRGSITGGLKDTLAPVLRSSTPENFSLNFKENEIILRFDEYVKLKNANKQLIISPPMKNQPIITPSTASKFVNIRIQDTLQPNTTYSFNFGQSITDNNEGNELNKFKYVFSTGSHLDSLSLAGKIKDAYNKIPDDFISVMLYEVNDTFKDSVIYKETPRYITNTLDSLQTFKLENLKAGKYLLIALKDKANNNKYNPKNDKIGFIKHFISIPNDTVFQIELFKETIPLEVLKPIQVSGNRLILPYGGEKLSRLSKPKIVLKNKNEILETIVTEFPKKDSLQVWFRPIKTDSLSLGVSKDNYKKDFTVKIKTQKNDTLNIIAIQNGIIHFRERFTLRTTTPLLKFDKTKIKLVNKDSVDVDFTPEYDEFEQKLYLDFKKEPSQKYNFTFFPGALTDFYEKSNDTVFYKLNTRKLEDYGNIVLNLQNVKRFPIIIELINKKGDEILATAYSEGETKFQFNLIEPELFTVRVIYDDNKNKTYDAGNYLKKEYAEEVNYLQKEFDVRANWDIDQTFDLSNQYSSDLEKKDSEKNKKDEKKRKKTAF